MTKEELIEKLRTKKGYLKSGVKFLAKKWDIPEELIKECKRLVSSEEYLQEKLVNENHNDVKETEFVEHLKSNGLTMADIKSVKFWQNFKGEQRYSIVTHNQWHEMTLVKDELLKYIKKNSHKVAKIKYKKSKDPILYEISIKMQPIKRT